MLEDGLVTTIIGMGVVFMFLTLLVFSMFVMAKVMLYVNKFFPEQALELAKTSSRSDSSELDEDIIAAIAVAKLNM